MELYTLSKFVWVSEKSMNFVMKRNVSISVNKWDLMTVIIVEPQLNWLGLVEVYELVMKQKWPKLRKWNKQITEK